MAKKRPSDSLTGISKQSEAQWQAQMDLDTLMRAREVKEDAKRFKAAQELAKKKLDEMGEFVMGEEESPEEEAKEKE